MALYWLINLMLILFVLSFVRIQEEREERVKFKKVCRSGGDPNESIAIFPETDSGRKSRFETDLDLSSSAGSLGMYDLTTDETSTNIYISSINPKVCVGH